MVDFLRNYWYLLVIVLVFGATFFYWWRYYAFTDQGYAPKQPIAFSHELHAGKHAMDCSYCHFNAERGRHAGVPPASVCLGCHSPDKGGVGAGIEEKVEKMVSIFSSEVEDSYTMHELTYFNVEGAPDAPQAPSKKKAASCIGSVFISCLTTCISHTNGTSLLAFPVRPATAPLRRWKSFINTLTLAWAGVSTVTATITTSVALALTVRAWRPSPSVLVTTM